MVKKSSLKAKNLQSFEFTKGGLIAKRFFTSFQTSNMPNYYPEHYPTKKKDSNLAPFFEIWAKMKSFMRLDHLYNNSFEQWKVRLIFETDHVRKSNFRQNLPCGLQKNHLYQGALARGIVHST